MRDTITKSGKEWGGKMIFETTSRLHARNMLLSNRTYVYFSWVPDEYKGVYTLEAFRERLSKFKWENLKALPLRSVIKATATTLTFTGGSELRLYGDADAPLCWVFCDDAGHAGVYMEFNNGRSHPRCNYYIFENPTTQREFMKYV